ncbi:MAG TPA: hypothetical protein VK362_09585, partial [Reyranella sp.]|nr:hypothetical protein [Reyranella sp.]
MQNQVVSLADLPRRRGHGAADWLSLAAAPTFAFMALLTAVPAAVRWTCSARLRPGRPPSPEWGSCTC